MPVVKDKNTDYEYTTENPYENSAPTWTAIDAQRMHGDSDRPQEENEEAEMLDGRSSAAGKSLGFGYVIKRTTDEGAEIAGLIDADDNETPVWIRETPEQEQAAPQIYGGITGCMPTVTRLNQSFGGYQAWRLDLSASGVSNLIVRERPSLVKELLSELQSYSDTKPTPVHAYSFDEGAGNTVSDGVGNKDFTLTSSYAWQSDGLTLSDSTQSVSDIDVSPPFTAIAVVRFETLTSADNLAFRFLDGTGVRGELGYTSSSWAVSN